MAAAVVRRSALACMTMTICRSHTSELYEYDHMSDVLSGPDWFSSRQLSHYHCRTLVHRVLRRAGGGKSIKKGRTCITQCSFLPYSFLLPAPIAQSGERWTPELTGSGSPVRAASTLAVCSWLGLPAVSGSGRAQGKLTSVERGGPCPAMWAR